MKSNKEIQLASKRFLRAFREQRVHEIPNSTFVPHNPASFYANQKWTLFSGSLSLFLFFLLSYNAIAIDAVYYWHIDTPVILGLATISIFLFIGLYQINKFREMDKVMKLFLIDPQQVSYGVIITDEYYFEKAPDAYHIIAKSNIIGLDYEEEYPNGEMYLELLVEEEKGIEVRGVIYNPQHFDLKAWLPPTNYTLTATA